MKQINLIAAGVAFLPITILWCAYSLFNADMTTIVFIVAIIHALLGAAALSFTFSASGMTKLAAAATSGGVLVILGGVLFAVAGMLIGAFASVESTEITGPLEITRSFAQIGAAAVAIMVAYAGASVSAYAAEKQTGMQHGSVFIRFFLATGIVGWGAHIILSNIVFWSFPVFVVSYMPAVLFVLIIFSLGVSGRRE